MSMTNVTRRSAIKIGAGAMALAAGTTMMASSNSSIARAGEAGDAVFTAPGTYTAEAYGRQGLISVTMTCSADAIESIEVDSVETKLLGKYAMDKLTDQVLEFQSVNFDNISGATFSCSGYREALTDCIEQAGGDLSKLNGEIVVEPNDYDTAADVVIIGAGGGGMTAALTAAQAGASVIVLEKGSVFGGNCNAAYSGINVANSQTLSDLGGSETIEEFVEMQTNDLADPVMVQAFAEATGPAADWLAGLGVPFTLNDRNPYQLEAAEDDSNTGGTIAHILWERLLDEDNVQMYLNTPVTSLVVDDTGTVVGVTATGDAGQDLTFTAGSVIIASGAYGKNHDFVVQCRPDFANTITDEIAPTTGDGLFMAQDLGADAVDLDQMQLYAHVNPIYGIMVGGRDSSGWSNGPSTVGIYVNKQAVRFAAEVYENEDAIKDQEDGIVYQIFPAGDEDNMTNTMLSHNCAWQADSPEVLAEDIGLDPTTLTQTIDTWNEGAVDGIDNEFGRDDAGVVPLEGTLDSFSIQQGVHYCMGGIKFDGSCHVIDTDGNIIPGLFACGECTGGVHGDTRVDGSAICDPFAFGHVAGQKAAEEALA